MVDPLDECLVKFGQDIEDILWALRYAQPYVDAQRDRPKTIDELDDGWTEEYKRFWIITQRLEMTVGTK